MAKPQSEEQIYEEAKQRVQAKKKFYGDLAFYLVVNIICVFVWAFTGQGYPWFLWVLGPWGILVLFHYLRVFVWDRKSDRRAIEKEAERIRREES